MAVKYYDVNMNFTMPRGDVIDIYNDSFNRHIEIGDDINFTYTIADITELLEDLDEAREWMTGTDQAEFDTFVSRLYEYSVDIVHKLAAIKGRV